MGKRPARRHHTGIFYKERDVVLAVAHVLPEPSMRSLRRVLCFDFVCGEVGGRAWP